MSAKIRIGYWMSDKKSQKVDWPEFQAVCQKYGFELFKIDFNIQLEEQEPFSIFLHKLTDLIVSANEGNETSQNILETIKKYIKTHPKLIVIDPIEKVSQVLNRYDTYQILKETNGMITPNFCHLPTANIKDIKQRLKDANIEYPFLCKPHLAHGSKKAHKMMLIFNENNLKDCMIPCVAQSFIKHNAVLYKIFIVGSKYYVVRRPSLKNFYPDSKSESIYFDSSLISKAGATSDLTVLDPSESNEDPKPDLQTVNWMAQTLRDAFGMSLLGADFVIDNNNGLYYIIDVNAYPGYDGCPKFYESLMHLMLAKIGNDQQDEFVDRSSLETNLNCDNFTSKTTNNDEFVSPPASIC